MLSRAKLAELRARGHAWLEGHPRMRRALDATGCLRGDRQSIARGIAAGLFVALTPLFGVQTLLLVPVCVLLRANFPAAFAASWLSNPFTIGPMLLAFNALGRVVSGMLSQPLTAAATTGGDALLQTQLTIIGSLLIAVPVSLLGYGAALWVQGRFADRAAGG